MIIIIISVQLIGYIIEIILTYTIKNKYLCPDWYLFLLSTITMLFIAIAIRLTIKTIYTFVVVSKKTDLIPTLIIGAGSVAKTIYEDSISNKNSKNKIVALIDDDPKKIGNLFRGIPIYGPINDIKSVIDEKKIETVIIAISTLSHERLKEILSLLKNSSVRVKRAPLLSEMNGPFDVKAMDVDLNELLGRQIVKLNNKDVTSMLKDKVVLVTGAGGSIGGELSKQIFDLKPRTLILFDIYENGVYDIQTSLTQRKRKEYIDTVEIITLIGSTYNYERMEQIISKYKPDYIYHAAAYKHVPLMEESPQEALRTNIIGTYNVAKLADKYEAKKMILVSTDKAVRPTNVMGATKKFAEEIIKYFSEISKHTNYAAVRFGNVLGSNGSVIPLFKKQIEGMGPVTITDKRIIRYFMAIEEAVALILQCGLYADKGDIFILDMGNPVKILDLAEMMIRQAGYKPYQDIKIIEVGLRPGEKLYEELLVDKKKHKRISDNHIFVEDKTKSSFSEDDIKSINKIINEKYKEQVKDELSKFVKSYTVSE